MATRKTPVPVHQRNAWEAGSELFPPLSQYGWRLLAEGDSWLSIGALNFKGTNILHSLKLYPSTVVVNCAYPGDTMVRIERMIDDPHFDRYLRHPNFATFFEGIILSAGGNDTIDAAQIPPVYKGKAVDVADRLLLTAAEAASLKPDVQGGERHISEAGWNKLAHYIHQAFLEINLRKNEGPSSGSPIFLHTYMEPVVRRAGIWPFMPDAWLCKAMDIYDIQPQATRQAVAHELFERLRALLLSFDQDSGHAHAVPRVHVFDAKVVNLDPAHPQDKGESGDWVNEIHPNTSGYIKFGQAFGPWLARIMHTYPGGRAYLNPGS